MSTYPYSCLQDYYFLELPTKDLYTINSKPAATRNHKTPPDVKNSANGNPAEFKLDADVSTSGKIYAITWNRTRTRTNTIIHFSMVPVSTL